MILIIIIVIIRMITYDICVAGRWTTPARPADPKYPHQIVR